MAFRRAHNMEDLLTGLLAAGEGGAPSISIGFDDATCNYVATQKQGFGMNAGEDHGYGRGIVGALLDLIEAQKARREGRERKDSDL